MAHLDRNRASRAMQAAGLDALLLLSPESFAYATGAPAGVAAMWRRCGAVAAVVPADTALTEAAVVTDLFEAAFRASSAIADIRINPIWVETADIRGMDAGSPEELIAAAWARQGRPAGFQRPETFDAATGFRLAAELLAARGLDKSRLGVEFDGLSVTDFRLLASALPDAELVDATDLVRRLKMIKSSTEIGYLRTAVELSEAGIVALRETIDIGISRDALAAAWETGVRAEVARRNVQNLTGLWEYVSVGQNPWTKGRVVEQGDLIKVDVGCLIAGYTSDTGRTFVYGKPSSLQARLFGALQTAYDAGLPLLKPGIAMSEVHKVTTEAMAKAGFPGYTRGHFGHGLGASLGSEEWPFLSRQSDVIIEPGMVLAFETPWYVDGVGGMIIENQLLITADGHEIMNRLPSGLVSL
ncbi:Xaa-Pro peptidase family protein [Pararhizobium sp. BT-229]|uniref:M24 family metallopeptidase n=1 Tax=Pararhizobium sp. BT-229 TaxID=2986923 RepID=UPI0021F7183E|nr:Xaa-Pro peptidase family protein [Pararhizobium sp. BT-229]MCV9966289.1 Xaa-Pro peptidase family protein [Pararhizobium sp. BT-229]